MIDVAHSQEETRIILERNEKELYIMAEFSFKNIFLAGVGATAYSFEKAQELVDDLVKKGELTVQQRIAGSGHGECCPQTCRCSTRYPCGWQRWRLSHGSRG